jgi:hypothetical protein
MLSGPLGLLILLAGSLEVASAASSSGLSSMSGFWRGPGRIEFSEGASEALVCKAYYAALDQRLSIVLLCASRSNKIELRAKLAADGQGLTGTWEERTFNASGTATGYAMDGKITLTIDGGGFTATMLVIQDDQQQTVSITAHGVAFTKVSVSLSRNASEQSDGRDEEHR